MEDDLDDFLEDDLDDLLREDPLKDAPPHRLTPRNIEIETMISDIVSHRHHLDAKALTAALRALPRQELNRLHKSLDLQR